MQPSLCGSSTKWSSQYQPSRYYGNSVALLSDKARDGMSRVQEIAQDNWCLVTV